ncbi:FecR family protein [Pseudomonas cyclaminis]|uniref:FecR family protein n=1 Tax=Pseudomonas cyclaminis TaxID=2781239 RepID=UPI0031346143
MSADLDQQAANWVIRLNEGNLSEREQQQFDRWKTADPQHAAAFERLQGFVGRLQALRPQQAPVQAALEAARVRRRNPAGRVLLGLLMALPVALALRAYPPSYLLADQRTAPAHWQRINLEDGSQLTLSGNSAVDLTFNGQQRQVRLLRGEILVQVAHDATRPFTVVTDDGQMRALGTRFTVRRDAGHAADHARVDRRRHRCRSAHCRERQCRRTGAHYAGRGDAAGQGRSPHHERRLAAPPVGGTGPAVAGSTG